MQRFMMHSLAHFRWVLFYPKNGFAFHIEQWSLWNSKSYLFGCSIYSNTIGLAPNTIHCIQRKCNFRFEKMHCCTRLQYSIELLNRHWLGIGCAIDFEKISTTQKSSNTMKNEWWKNIRPEIYFAIHEHSTKWLCALTLCSDTEIKRVSCFFSCAVVVVIRLLRTA